MESTRIGRSHSGAVLLTVLILVCFLPPAAATDLLNIDRITPQDQDVTIDANLAMTGDISMDGQTITGLANPDSSDEAMTLGYANSEYVRRSGDSMTGNLDIQNNAISLDSIGKDEIVSSPYSSTSISDTGWYRIAVNGEPLGEDNGNRAGARFTVMDTEGGQHSYLTFYASNLYNSQGGMLNVLNYAHHGSSGGAIRGVRLVHDSTYDGAAVEVYMADADSSSFDFVIHENYQNSGWDPVNWEPGNVPDGFQTTEIDLDENAIMAAAKDGGTNEFLVEKGGDLSLDGDLNLGGTMTSGTVPTARLDQDSVTIGSGDHLTGGGSVSLGDSTTLNVDAGSMGWNDLGIGQSDVDPEDVGLATLSTGSGLSGSGYDGTGAESWDVAWGDASDLDSGGSISSGSVGTTELDTSDVDGRYVNRGGDSMTGDLDMNENNVNDANHVNGSRGEFTDGLTLPVGEDAY